MKHLGEFEFEVLNNRSTWHELYFWAYFMDQKKTPTTWLLLGRGTKEQMLWAMKVHIEMMLEYGGVPKRYEDLLAMFASYLILTPQNEILEIPAFKEIKPWTADITLDEQTQHNMALIDQFPKLQIVYKDRVKIK